MKTFIFSFVFVFVIAGKSYADFEKHFYVGLGVNYSDFPSSMFKNDGHKSKKIGGKIFGGYRFDEYLSVELGLQYLGKIRVFQYEYSGQDSRFHDNFYTGLGSSLALMGIVPITKSFEIFGKAGGIYNRFGIGGSDFPLDESASLSALMGAGLIFKLTDKFSIRAETEFIPSYIFKEDYLSSSASVILRF